VKALRFGEDVPGFEIPVLNEREIRAAAGLFFVVMFAAIQRVVYTWDFTLLRYAATFFLADFAVRLFIGTRWAPSLILARLIVHRQTPEYVGAAQKRFAWTIGLVLGVVMFVTLNVLNLHGPFTGLICFACLVFLLFESAFGICLGCVAYKWFYKKEARYCPGEVCEVKDRQPIQRTSRAQLAALVVFLAVFGAATVPLKGHFSQKPDLVMGMEQPPGTRQASP
jgi:hypothetical protein